MRHFLAAAFVLALLVPAGCGPEDFESPTVSWVHPQDGDTIDPGVYELVTVATDNVGVKRVFLFAFSEMLGIVSRHDADTFRLAVDCRADTGQSYQLQAQAQDFAGNNAFAKVTIYVRR